MVVKVLASDFDGTLTDTRGLLSPEAVRAVRSLEYRGVRVSLISGMNYPSLNKLSLYIGCGGAVVAENGSIIRYGDKLRVIGDGEASRKVLKALKERFPELVESWDIDYRSVDLGFKRDLPKAEISKFLDRYPEVRFMDSGVAYHVLDRRVDKGLGLRVAADFMKVKTSDIAVVGDNENDLDMFDEAGFTIALANAPQRLKGKADYVTSRGGGLGFVEASNMIMAQLEKKIVGVAYPTSTAYPQGCEEVWNSMRKYSDERGWIPLDISKERSQGFDSLMDCIMRSDLIVVFIPNPENLIDSYPEILYARWIGKKVTAVSPQPVTEKIFERVYSSVDELSSELSEALE